MANSKFMTYNPYKTMGDLENLQKFYQNFFGIPTRNVATTQEWAPTVDIYESTDELVFQSELPGFSEADFKVSTENNVLKLSGERKFDQTKYKIHHKERSQGVFERSFTVPTTFDLSNVKASYKDGILSISVPKRVEARSRQIEVKIK
jgi:HSP20 family protein